MDRLIRLRALHESVLKRLPNVDDRIFLSPAGCPWPRESTNARRLLDRLLNQAGIPKVNHAGEKLTQNVSFSFAEITNKTDAVTNGL